MPESGGGVSRCAPPRWTMCFLGGGVKHNQPAQPLHVARSGFGEHHFSQGEEESWKLTTPQILRGSNFFFPESPSGGSRASLRCQASWHPERLARGAPRRCPGAGRRFLCLGAPKGAGTLLPGSLCRSGLWLLQFFVWRAQGAASPRKRVGWGGWARTVFPGPPHLRCR